MTENYYKEQIWHMLNKLSDYIIAGEKKRHSDLPPPDTLEQIADEATCCHKCNDVWQRRNVVCSDGSLTAKLLVISAAPTAEDDASAIALSGQAGEYLDKWLTAIKLNRKSDVFITLLSKCFNSALTDVSQTDLLNCRSYWQRELKLLRPKAILALGASCANFLLNTKNPIEQLRQNRHFYSSIPVVVTYHPQQVLTNPRLRSAVWQDLQTLSAFF